MMNKRKQKGATFVSWIIGAAIFMFLTVTGIKMVPIYIEYNTIKTMVDELAAHPDAKSSNKRIMRSALSKRLNINSLDRHVSAKNFDIKRIKGSNKRKEITVNYEVRKPWFANMDFIATFKYAKEIGID